MILKVNNVWTGMRETKDLDYGERCLFIFDEFGCIINPLKIGKYQLINAFGWEEEVEYNIEEVRGFFKLLNNYTILTICENLSKEKEFFENAKNELKKINKWEFDLDRYVNC